MTSIVVTYRELGKRLGLSPEAARKRAKARGWRVVAGNDGRARVQVSDADLVAEDGRSPAGDRPEKSGASGGDVRGVEALLASKDALAEELRERVRLLESRLEAQDLTIADLRCERDRLLEMLARVDPPRRRGWLARLLGL